MRKVLFLVALAREKHPDFAIFAIVSAISLHIFFASVPI